MTEDDDLQILRDFGADPAPMTQHTMNRIYFRALNGVSTAGTGRVRSRRRLTVALRVAVVLAVFVGIVVATVSGPSPGSSASAAVLDRAAKFASAAQPVVGRPGQYIYRSIIRHNGPDLLTVRSWEPVDGQGSELQEITDNGKTTRTVLAEEIDSTLAAAPYTELLRLEQLDPSALLSRIQTDPATKADIINNGASLNAATWEQIRLLSERIPPQGQAKLFTAAKAITGLTVIPNVADAAGRAGTGLSITDPRLGKIELIFSSSDGQFLGEQILQLGNDSNQFSSSVTAVAVVDRPGQLPNR